MFYKFDYGREGSLRTYVAAAVVHRSDPVVLYHNVFLRLVVISYWQRKRLLVCKSNMNVKYNRCSVGVVPEMNQNTMAYKAGINGPKN